MSQKPIVVRALKPEEFEVLFALSAGDLHGYALTQRIAENSNGAVTIQPTLLYRKLRRLMEQGWIEEAAESLDPEDDQRRRYYRLSGEGFRALAREANRLAQVGARLRSMKILDTPRAR